MAKQKPNPYKIMTSILTDYAPTYDEKLTLNSFFMCRYLSNDPRGVVVANLVNYYYNQIPLNVQYDFAKQVLYGEIKFIQTPKKEKLDSKLLDNISRFYKVNFEHAIEYSELMNDEDKDEFRTMYDCN